MPRRSSLACAVVAVVVAGSAPCAASDLVGILKNQGAIDGCSWSATAEPFGKAFIFLAEYDESVVIMNIGGKDVHLVAEPKRSTARFGKVGSRLSRTYTAPGILVKAVYTATWVCPANDESCEVTKFEVVFTVEAGAASQVVEGRGDVGC
jgi:hypothetical protein